MVFNSWMVVTVANISAEAWQCLACIPERVSSDELLDLVCCLPLHQLGRLALCFWTFFCLPPSPDSYYYSYDSDSDDSSSSSSASSSSSYYHHHHAQTYHSHSD